MRRYRMSRIQYDDVLSYEIFDNGYDIFDRYQSEEIPWITQRDPYSKLFVPNGSYEDNALAQLKQITEPVKEEPIS